MMVDSGMRINDHSERLPVSRGQGREQVKKKDGTTQRTDRVDLSSAPTAKAANRDAKLDNIRKNIQNGVYARPSFARTMADRLLSKGALDDSDAASGALKASEMPADGSAPDIRADRIEDVRRKIASGEYSDEKVIEDIASKIMKTFGFNTND
jgi:anti-sigma28 factor (negative regulator of flagellin synthesis)